jgi:hypothetical protein
LANETYKADTDRSVAEIQRVFESNLLHRYLNSLLNGGNLDPTKNIAAVSYIPELKTTLLHLRRMPKRNWHHDKSEKLTQTVLKKQKSI